MAKSIHPFQIHPDPDGVLRLSGGFDTADMAGFVRKATAVVDSRREVVMDLTDLTFIDPSGIRTIISFERLICGRGLVLRNPTDSVRLVLSVAGVGRLAGIRIE